jgi:uncharacterized protein
MPLPKPKDSETEKDFIKRCMSDDLMKEEFDDNDQRLAVCYAQWNKQKGEKRMERKSFKFDLKTVDEEEGVIEGYAATFRSKPDAYGDIIEPGAFTKTLKDNKGVVASLFNHMVEFPIGNAEVSEDEKGLFARIKIVRGVQKAEETLKLAKAGVIKRMSIGYEAVKAPVEDNIRKLKEVRLYDASPVVFAADDRASVTAVKSLEDRIDELEAEIKEGRVLSSSNLQKVRAAMEALQKLIETAASEEEPSDDTPEKTPKTDTSKSAEPIEHSDDFEAAEDAIDRVIARLQGFDTQKAEARFNAISKKMKGEN